MEAAYFLGLDITRSVLAVGATMPVMYPGVARVRTAHWHGLSWVGSALVIITIIDPDNVVGSVTGFVQRE